MPIKKYIRRVCVNNNPTMAQNATWAGILRVAQKNHVSFHLMSMPGETNGPWDALYHTLFIMVRVIFCLRHKKLQALTIPCKHLILNCTAKILIYTSNYCRGTTSCLKQF